MMLYIYISFYPQEDPYCSPVESCKSVLLPSFFLCGRRTRSIKKMWKSSGPCLPDHRALQQLFVWNCRKMTKFIEFQLTVQWFGHLENDLSSTCFRWFQVGFLDAAARIQIQNAIINHIVIIHHYTPLTRTRGLVVHDLCTCAALGQQDSHINSYPIISNQFQSNHIIMLSV